MLNRGSAAAKGTKKIKFRQGVKFIVAGNCVIWTSTLDQLSAMSLLETAAEITKQGGAEIASLNLWKRFATIGANVLKAGGRQRLSHG